MSSLGSPLAHQFDDMPQQKLAASLGMWVFLLTEVLFFGALFASYAVYRFLYPGAFHAASHHLDVVLGTINTAVLIASSLMMALAVHSAELDRRRATSFFLALTMALGTVFLAIKFVEYQHKFHEHLVPGVAFAYHGAAAAKQQLFFSLYFAMTGLHALHMIIGLGLMTWMLVWNGMGRFSSAYHTPVEMVGLYWHFVDIVWIFLFPLLYLVGRH
jgi:cytochrome c oxidase subunit III